ncbi:MATE family efflux transporter [Acidaminobacterium chupaoyuni]
MAKKNYEMDMCRGPLLSKILIFALPLMLSGVLQLLFNAADIAVVGRFSGRTALAAVGSTSALINLLVNLFVGLSIGANVLVAQRYGAGDGEGVSRAVHTAMLISMIGGVIMVFVGVLLARPLLTLMGTPAEVIDMSVVYMRIFFCGMPVMLVYNFGAAILRSVGDTKRPLYFLVVAGAINVVLNLFFVIVCGMDVDGVALATVISQTVSAFLILQCLIRSEGVCRLELKKLHLHRTELLKIIRVGLPAGLQGIIFSISNVLIQSSVNSFGAVAMAGNTAASNIEGFVYTGMNSIYQTTLSFTGQNLGARQYHRISRVLRTCLMLVSVVGLVMGLSALGFGKQLLHIYTADPEVVKFGLMRLGIIAATYFLCGLMDVMAGVMRGLGYSILPMIVSLTGACGLRVLWIFTIFAANHTLKTLYVSYPISWFVTFAAHVVCYWVVRRKMPKTDEPLPDTAEEAEVLPA